MRLLTRNLLACTLGATALPALAVDTTMTAAGYTGLGVTPNAHLLGWGRLEASYDKQLPGVVQDPSGHNYALGFGLLPNLEISGRLATSTLNDFCFGSPGCGAARDLSASGKVAIGLDAANRFRIAAGATDIGGAATYFRTYYGVLTYNEGPFEVSAGLASRSGAGVRGSRSPLHGPFAAAAWQPVPLLRGHVEYADGNAWAGVRVFAPAQWLPEGWSLSAGANVRLNDNNLTERAWWTASLSIPLYKVPTLPGRTAAPLPPLQPGQQPLPAYEARIPAPDSQPPLGSKPAPQQAPIGPAHPPAATETRTATLPTDAQLQQLASALEAKGLDDIWIGRMPDGTVAVRANNAAYTWNAADALGAALGAIARTLSETRAGYRLILTERQVPLVAVTGQADCLREWIEQPTNSCTAGQLSTPGSLPLEPLHEGAQWLVQRHKPGWQTARVRVSPVLRTTVGTELGALDYALGANIGAQLPLWAGASVEAGVNVPVTQSEDFEQGRGFGNRRIPSGLERLTFTQTARVPLEQWLSPAQGLRWKPSALTAQATVGRIGSFFDGALGELRWEPGDGRHRVHAQAGLFRNNEYRGGLGPLGTLRRAAPLLASYRYSVMATRTDLEATAGQFMNNDRGLQLGLRQWFTDVSVGIYYKRTRFPGQAVQQAAGIELTFPLGPRRDWQPLSFLQVGGSPRFSHSVETTIRDNAGNPVRSGQAARPPVTDLNQVFNSDRSGLAWFEDNVRRIRDAAR